MYIVQFDEIFNCCVDINVMNSSPSFFKRKDNNDEIILVNTKRYQICSFVEAAG